MTLQEIENELKSLREQVLQQQRQEEARRSNWRGVRKGVAICGLLFICGGIGLLAFSIAHSDTRIEPFQAAITFIMLSLPMSLLGAALR
jgi:hypothetical protein